MISDFEYFSPKTLQEALGLLDKYREDYKIIAGGQSLLIMMRQGLIKPRTLIDIKGISDLDYIKYDERKGLRIGSLTTHRTIEKSPVIMESFGILSEMESKLASIQTRNWGSIGGNLCHGDPAGDPAPILMTLNGTLTLTSLKGERTVMVEDFFLDYFETALEPGELLTEIQIPPIPKNTGVAYSKFNVIENDMAIVGVGISITLAQKDSQCKDVRIALANASPRPMRAKQAEEVLRGKKITDELLSQAGEIASQEVDPISDIHASTEYRRELLKVLVKRVGKEALLRAKKL
ncbi:MAG: FAD binding domain-containing protein [Thermodesulfobacteriota bacterium]